MIKKPILLLVLSCFILTSCTAIKYYSELNAPNQIDWLIVQDKRNVGENNLYNKILPKKFRKATETLLLEKGFKKSNNITMYLIVNEFQHAAAISGYGFTWIEKTFAKIKIKIKQDGVTVYSNSYAESFAKSESTIVPFSSEQAMKSADSVNRGALVIMKKILSDPLLLNKLK